MIRALLLDLDGTLLDLDGNDFLDDYCEAVAEWMTPLVTPARFLDLLMAAAIPTVVTEHPGRSNREVLWQALADALEIPRDRLESRFQTFMASDLTKIFPGGGPRPGAHRLITEARRLGLKIAVATMPIYPRKVVDERLRRAGLDQLPWDAVATQDMQSVKPHPTYFLELARTLQTDARYCLMVGDDYFQDIPARNTGMHTFYVGPQMVGLDPGPKGSLDDLADCLEKTCGLS